MKEITSNCKKHLYAAINFSTCHQRALKYWNVPCRNEHASFKWLNIHDQMIALHVETSTHGNIFNAPCHTKKTFHAITLLHIIATNITHTQHKKTWSWSEQL